MDGENAVKAVVSTRSFFHAFSVGRRVIENYFLTKLLALTECYLMIVDVLTTAFDTKIKKNTDVSTSHEYHERLRSLLVGLTSYY